MSTKQMQELIDLLKEFKQELTASEDKREVNKVMKIIDQTIKEKKYYENEIEE